MITFQTEYNNILEPLNCYRLESYIKDFSEEKNYLNYFVGLSNVLLPSMLDDTMLIVGYVSDKMVKGAYDSFEDIPNGEFQIGEINKNEKMLLAYTSHQYFTEGKNSTNGAILTINKLFEIVVTNHLDGVIINDKLAVYTVVIRMLMAKYDEWRRNEGYTKIVVNTKRFQTFRSRTLDALNEDGKYEWLCGMLSSHIVEKLWNEGHKLEALYLVCLIDTICQEYEQPFYIAYDFIRQIRLDRIFFADTAQLGKNDEWLDEKASIFAKHNIVEKHI